MNFNPKENQAMKPPPSPRAKLPTTVTTAKNQPRLSPDAAMELTKLGESSLEESIKEKSKSKFLLDNKRKDLQTSKPCATRTTTRAMPLEKKMGDNEASSIGKEDRMDGTMADFWQAEFRRQSLFQENNNLPPTKDLESRSTLGSDSESSSELISTMQPNRIVSSFQAIKASNSNEETLRKQDKTKQGSIAKKIKGDGVLSASMNTNQTSEKDIETHNDQANTTRVQARPRLSFSVFRKSDENVGTPSTAKAAAATTTSIVEKEEDTTKNESEQYEKEMNTFWTSEFRRQSVCRKSRTPPASCGSVFGTTSSEFMSLELKSVDDKDIDDNNNIAKNESNSESGSPTKAQEKQQEQTTVEKMVWNSTHANTPQSHGDCGKGSLHQDGTASRTHSERSMPGAFAHAGPTFTRVSSTTAMLIDAVNRQQEGEVATANSRTEIEGQTYNMSTDSMDVPTGTAQRLSASYPEAQMVDDVETVVYAKDIQKDNFQKLAILGVILAVIFCGVILGVIFGRKDEVPRSSLTCVYDDIRCCEPLDSMSLPKSIPFRCYCFNSTEGIYSNFTDKTKRYYESGVELFNYLNLLDPGDIASVDPESSCDSYHQLTLSLAIIESAEEGLSIAHVPNSVKRAIFALALLYVTSDGYDWYQSDGWLDERDICYWFGVKCLFADAVDELLLPSNNLVGPIPSEFGYLESLHNLDLSGNTNLTGPLPMEFVQMTSLDFLDLSRVPLNQSIPTWLGNMAGLQRLSLREAHLQGTIPSEIAQMSSLNRLRLSFNSLSGPLPSEIGVMTNLKLLDIGDNNLNGTIPDFLGKMPSLSMINLRRSGLTGRLPESLCSVDISREIVVECELIDISSCSCCSDMVIFDPPVLVRCMEDFPFDDLLV